MVAILLNIFHSLSSPSFNLSFHLFSPPSFPPSFWSSFLLSNQDLFYNGENHSLEQPQSLTCPLCGQLGFSESQLREHVTKQHSDSTTLQEVICPVCAAHPSGDPNHLTDDLPTHLTVEHRALREMELMIS